MYIDKCVLNNNYYNEHFCGILCYVYGNLYNMYVTVFPR